ncbi:hypothetical protein EMIT0P218_130115 [Pseudomonas sp. IT-P218]
MPGICRSRLAGEGGLEFCVGLEGPFAGKPAPTKTSWHWPGFVGAGLPAKAVLNFVLGLRDPSLASQLLQKIVALHGTCRSRLAGEGGLEFCVGLEGPFAGKPAPTKTSWHWP